MKLLQSLINKIARMYFANELRKDEAELKGLDARLGRNIEAIKQREAFAIIEQQHQRDIREAELKLSISKHKKDLDLYREPNKDRYSQALCNKEVLLS